MSNTSDLLFRDDTTVSATIAKSSGHEDEYDVVIIGGGPAGSALGTLLARDGFKALIIEKDVHPRDHVGESLTPSTNLSLENSVGVRVR